MLSFSLVHRYAKRFRHDCWAGRLDRHLLESCRGRRLSPINICSLNLTIRQPNDLTKQSLPFSYLALSVASNDGSSHSVQVYTDISAEWVSGDNSLVANWTTTTTGGILTHQVQLESQSIYGEVSDHIQREQAFSDNCNSSTDK